MPFQFFWSASLVYTVSGRWGLPVRRDPGPGWHRQRDCEAHSYVTFPAGYPEWLLQSKGNRL